MVLERTQFVGEQVSKGSLPHSSHYSNEFPHQEGAEAAVDHEHKKSEENEGMDRCNVAFPGISSRFVRG